LDYFVLQFFRLGVPFLDRMSGPNETIGTWAMLRLLLVMMKFLPQKLVLFLCVFSLSRRLRDIV
jgi:hypothetical protein